MAPRIRLKLGVKNTPAPPQDIPTNEIISTASNVPPKKARGRPRKIKSESQLNFERQLRNTAARIKRQNAVAVTPSQSEDVMPTSLPQPSEDVMPPSHIHRHNVQLLNITRGLHDIAQRQEENRQEAMTQAEETRTQQQQEVDNRQAGSMRSPWTRIKPLKPSPLDIYDRQINAQRKWVRVYER
jgi:hypothetical protein